MEDFDNQSSADSPPGIPTWRFYLYALWLVGIALIFMVVLVSVAPVPTTEHKPNTSRDMTALDAAKDEHNGRRTHEGR